MRPRRDVLNGREPVSVDRFPGDWGELVAGQLAASCSWDWQWRLATTDCSLRQLASARGRLPVGRLLHCAARPLPIAGLPGGLTVAVCTVGSFLTCPSCWLLVRQSLARVSPRESQRSVTLEISEARPCRRRRPLSPQLRSRIVARPGHCHSVSQAVRTRTAEPSSSQASKATIGSHRQPYQRAHLCSIGACSIESPNSSMPSGSQARHRH